MSEIEAKVRYVKLARSLKTYGVSFFLVKVEQQPSPSHFKLTKVLLLQHPSICCLQLLPLNLCCSSFLCISPVHLSFSHFPVHCLPTLWFMLFLIVKLHVIVVTTRKRSLAGVW